MRERDGGATGHRSSTDDTPLPMISTVP
ncbi:uncharacterized protein METZ01_LOCUS146773, partial [marine metagenome]